MIDFLQKVSSRGRAAWTRNLAGRRAASTEMLNQIQHDDGVDAAASIFRKPVSRLDFLWPVVPGGAQRRPGISVIAVLLYRGDELSAV